VKNGSESQFYEVENEDEEIPARNSTYNKQLCFANKEVRVVRHIEDTTIITYDVTNTFLKSKTSSSQGDGTNIHMATEESNHDTFQT